MKNHWVIFVAKRYLRTKRKEKGLSTAFLSIVGIVVGTMALITVNSVMNGFQIGPIEDTLEIGSYHIRIQDLGYEVEPALGAFEQIEGVRAVLPFREIQTMIKGRTRAYNVAQIRGVPEDTPERDPGLISQLQIEPEEFDLSGENKIVLGGHLADMLGVFEGDKVEVILLGGGGFNSLKTVSKTFEVSGVFRCGYGEYDKILAYVSDSAEIFSESDKWEVGIKLENRYRDRETAAKLDRLYPDDKVVSWRVFNRAYFGALRMEKIALFFLIALIILVVGVNIFNSLRRTVFERREEIGLLRSVGASPMTSRMIFIFEGALIGLIGGGLGVISGLLVTLHINPIMSFLDNTIFMILGAVDYILIQFGIYSLVIENMLDQPQLLMQDLPVKIIFAEVWGVFLYALLSSMGAAFLASSQISKIKPSEVLRYE